MLKFKKISYLCGFLLCGLGLVAHAQQNLDLYQGKVPVASEQVAEREAALPKALAQVLVKVSGESKSANLPVAKDKTLASAWVQQYHYEERVTPEGKQVEVAVDFNPTAINDYLKKVKVPIWAGYRPLTLVFIAADEAGTQAIVGEDPVLAHWQNAFTQYSQDRSVPVLFPLLDLTDKQMVAVNDVWYHQSTVLQQVAARYQAENVLSARIYLNNATNNWEADWMLAMPAEQVIWQQVAATPDALIKAGVDKFADAVATHYRASLSTTEGLNVSLSVENVGNIEAYLATLSYLKGLDAVSSVTTIELAPNLVIFQINLATPVAALEQEITKGSVLKSSLTPNASTHLLRYQYL